MKHIIFLLTIFMLILSYSGISNSKEIIKKEIILIKKCDNDKNSEDFIKYLEDELDYLNIRKIKSKNQNDPFNIFLSLVVNTKNNIVGVGYLIGIIYSENQENLSVGSNVFMCNIDNIEFCAIKFSQFIDIMIEEIYNKFKK